MKDWSNVEFSKVCKKTGLNYQPDKTGKLPYIGLEHIESGSAILKTWGIENEVKSSKTKFKKGQILYGKLRPYLDKSIIAPFDGVCSTDILVFDSTDLALNEYLVYLIHSYGFINYAKSTTSGVQHPRTSWNVIKKFNFNLPPLHEQRNIAYVLSTVQKAMEQQDKLIRTTTELKKALMQKLFTEGTNGEKQKQTEIGLVPESWKVIDFPKFVLLQRGKDLIKKDFIEGSIPVAGSNGIIGYHNASFVKAPGVTVGRSGSCGKVWFYETDFWAHNTSLYVKNFNGNNAKFSYYYLQYLDIGRFKTGASVPTLDRNSLNTFKISVPPNAEQSEIANSIHAVECKINIHQKKKQILMDMFKTLLHELMTGQRRVNHIEF